MINTYERSFSFPPPPLISLLQSKNPVFMFKAFPYDWEKSSHIRVLEKVANLLLRPPRRGRWTCFDLFPKRRNRIPHRRATQTVSTPPIGRPFLRTFYPPSARKQVGSLFRMNKVPFRRSPRSPHSTLGTKKQRGFFRYPLSFLPRKATPSSRWAPQPTNNFLSSAEQLVGSQRVYLLAPLSLFFLSRTAPHSFDRV